MVTQWMAAMPDANPSAPVPDSSEASVVSKALRVGFPLRE